MDNEIVCIMAPDDPALAASRPCAADLAERAWLLREPGSGTRALNEQFLADRGLTPRTLTLGSNGAIKQAARVGLGVSLVSRAAVEAELARTPGRAAPARPPRRSPLVRALVRGRARS